MPGLAAPVDRYSVVIAIGGVSIRVHTADSDFLAILQRRYAGFLGGDPQAEFDFDVELGTPPFGTPLPEVSVTHRAGRWFMEREDFRAEWDPAARRGSIQQSANPYSIDAFLRIVHTLVLAKLGGFLLHSASAVRNGKAFLFAGESGAGKTTISRLAPPDVTLLTDEMSYIRQRDDAYVAFGTPFTGELVQAGENTSAPVAALYLLHQGPENRIERLAIAEAGRGLLANILFFAEDPELVHSMFRAGCDFVGRVPVYKLTFMPDARVWEMIQ